jgi:cation diffusion facilitator family transporter
VAGASFKAVIAAFSANLGIGIAKFIGASISGSASMFAEGIHSVVDCSNQLLLLFGKRAASKPPDDVHPLGYGREHFFWSFMVAILLFSLGGVFAIYEGIQKLHSTEPIRTPWLGLAIFIFGILLEGLALRTCLKEVRAQNRFGNLWRWFKETTSSDLLVLFTEDSAAIVGLLIASIFLTISWITGDPSWDARGSILIGVLLVIVAFILGIEVKSLLIGEAPTVNYRPEIEQIVAQCIPDGKVLRLIALQMGGEEVLVSYKVTCGSVTNTRELVDAINQTERLVRAKFPEIRWQFVEPDDHA